MNKDQYYVPFIWDDDDDEDEFDFHACDSFEEEAYPSLFNVSRQRIIQNANLTSERLAQSVETSVYEEPQTFHSEIITPMRQDLETALKTEKKVNNEQLYRLSFLYQHYDFFLHNISSLIRKKNGSSGCMERSHALLNAYQRYVIEGRNPETTELPHFGTSQQWISYCEALQDMYEGRPENYVQAMIQLS